MSELKSSKILWHSLANAPWGGTGYSQQTALFAPKLAEKYGVSISAFWGLEGNVIPWNGIPVLPGLGSTYGDEAIPDHARIVFGPDSRNGLILTLLDVWVLDPTIWRDFNVLSWVPVDHEPCPRPVARFFENSGAIPMAMSKFGAEMLEELNPLYCPHGVDTAVYKPLPQKEAREATGMPEDRYIVGMVAANKGNPSRKCFSEAFQAFKVFHERHPDSMLYLHTEMSGRFQGVNLINLLDATGVPLSAVISADQYRTVHMPFPGETMAQVFNSIDVLLSPSAGEGFGICVIEAQACGVPVIVSDFTAQPELVGAGWCVEGTKHFTPMGSWQFRPDVADILEALECAYRERENPAIAEKARAKALEYDAQAVFVEHMLPALAEAQERFDARKPMKVAA